MVPNIAVSLSTQLLLPLQLKSLVLILQLSGSDISADLQASVGGSQRQHNPTPISFHSSFHSSLILAVCLPAVFEAVHLNQCSLALSLSRAFQVKRAWTVLGILSSLPSQGWTYFIDASMEQMCFHKNVQVYDLLSCAEEIAYACV